MPMIPGGVGLVVVNIVFVVRDVLRRDMVGTEVTGLVVDVKVGGNDSEKNDGD